MSKKRILHIEDDADNRRLVRKVLEAYGFDVLEATDGVSGIKLAMARKPDLILVDINLPYLDGYEVTLKLRDEFGERRVPIVAITAEGSRDMSLAVGFDGFIQKPINVTEFAPQLDAFLDGYREKDSQGNRQDLLLEQSRKIVSRLEKSVTELTEANRKLREADKIRSEFYRNISHELSTPLTPVIGYLSLLQDEELGPLTDLQKRCLASVSQCYTRIRSLIENLLDITAMQTGRMNFFHRDYDFAQIARNSAERLKPLFDEKGLELEISIPDAAFPARGDPDKLARAMVLLIENAMKFTEEGKVLVSVRRKPEGFGFAVYDSGIGIEKDMLREIFSSFYQADGSVTRVYQGAGLGLAITQKVIEAFGGRVWAESPPEDTSDDTGWAKTMVAFVVPMIMPKKDDEEPASQ